MTAEKSEMLGHLVYLTSVVDRMAAELMTARIAADLLMDDKSIDINTAVQMAEKIMKFSKQAVAEEEKR